MNIPFYRYVDDDHDGHTYYQCLNCGTSLDTIGHEFLGCPYCLIRFQGMILPKYKFEVHIPYPQESTTNLWQVEHSLRFDKDEAYNWTCYSGTYPADAKKAVEDMKWARKETAKDGDTWIHDLRFTKYVVKQQQYYKLNQRKFFKKFGRFYLPPAK